jgi:hypothetical protein
MSDPKETDFFQHHYDRGIAYLEECFDHCPDVRAYGETSPGNMIHPKAAERIATHFPTARIIFVLRNPIERAYSQYLYGIMLGTDSPTDSFSDLIRDPNDDWGQRILELGLYYKQIRRFERHFSHDQMWVGLFRDFKQKNEEFVRSILEFIDIEKKPQVNVDEKHNTTRYPRSKRILRAVYTLWEPVKSILPESVLGQMHGLRSGVRDALFQSGAQEKPSMKPADRKYLRDYYAEPNRRLENWLGRGLSHWT